MNSLLSLTAPQILDKFDADGKLSDEDLASARDAFAEARVSKVANMSRSNPYFQVQAKDSLKVRLPSSSSPSHSP